MSTPPDNNPAHRSIILKLLENNATPSSTLISTLHKYPSALCSSPGKLPVVFLYLSNGAKTSNSLAILKTLLSLTSSSDLQHLTPTGNSLLHVCAGIIFPSSINLLLSNPDIIRTLNAVNSNGDTALHYACYYNNQEAVSALLDVDNVDVNIENKDNIKPLTMLLPSNNPPVILKYLEKGGECDWSKWKGTDDKVEEVRLKVLGLEIDGVGRVIDSKELKKEEKKKKKKKMKNKIFKPTSNQVKDDEQDNNEVEVEDEVPAVKTWSSVLQTTINQSIDNNVSEWETVTKKKPNKTNGNKVTTTQGKKETTCECHTLLKFKPELKHLGISISDFFKDPVALAMLSPSQLGSVGDVVGEMVKSVEEAKMIQRRVLDLNVER